MKPAHKSGQLAISRQGVPGPSDPWGFQLRSAESRIPQDRLVNWEQLMALRYRIFTKAQKTIARASFPKDFCTPVFTAAGHVTSVPSGKASLELRILFRLLIGLWPSGTTIRPVRGSACCLGPPDTGARRRGRTRECSERRCLHSDTALRRLPGM